MYNFCIYTFTFHLKIWFKRLANHSWHPIYDTNQRLASPSRTTWVRGRGFRPLAHNHQVSSCKDVFRCIRCHRPGQCCFGSTCNSSLPLSALPVDPVDLGTCAACLLSWLCFAWYLSCRPMIRAMNSITPPHRLQGYNYGADGSGTTWSLNKEAGGV
jgi:hypothetical protein